MFKNSIRQDTDTPQIQSSIPETSVVPQPIPKPPPRDSVLAKGLHQAEQGDYLQAYQTFERAGRDPFARNAQAVCLMRLQRFTEASSLLRDLVLPHGCTWVRKDAHPTIVANYATALFYGGLASGALQVLNDSNVEDDAGIVSLRSAMTTWVAKMPFFQRWNWHINRIAPSTLPTPPEQPLGEFCWQ